MMERMLTLEEAVLVFLISIFFHTLLHYIRYTVNTQYRKKEKGDDGQ
jgi:predicted SprT family Zn-dependent metalloprotease